MKFSLQKDALFEHCSICFCSFFFMHDQNWERDRQTHEIIKKEKPKIVHLNLVIAFYSFILLNFRIICYFIVWNDCDSTAMATIVFINILFEHFHFDLSHDQHSTIPFVCILFEEHLANIFFFGIIKVKFNIRIKMDTWMNCLNSHNTNSRHHFTIGINNLILLLSLVLPKFVECIFIVHCLR